MADNRTDSVSGFRERVTALEESYEFMLAFAAQGISGDSSSKSIGQLREFLDKADQALDGLSGAFEAVVQSEGLEPKESYGAFATTLAGDAEASRSTILLAQAQERISSQLIDNLNASIHIRALLTDLFFIDEVLKEATREKASSESPT